MTDMQPENVHSPHNLEQSGPESQASSERLPVLPMPEGGIETGAERREQSAEARAAVSDASAIATPLGPTPVYSTDPVGLSDDDAKDTTQSSPLVAADEDLIEKEWVDKAKKIISDTRDDPFRREAAVSQLQRDYLKKRYGKDVADAA